MSRFRRYSRHQRGKRSGSIRQYAVLFLLAALVIWILTSDLEGSVAMKWLSGHHLPPANQELEIKVFNTGQFAVAEWDSIPIWVTRPYDELEEGNTTIFEETELGRSYRIDISKEQLPLWNDYVRHLDEWSLDCDTIFLVYGVLPDSGNVYTINLCIQENSYGQAIVFPHELSSLPFFEFTHSINEVERWTGIDFFSDLLDEESENYIEKYHRRMQWVYPKTSYEKRIIENNKIKNGD